MFASSLPWVASHKTFRHFDAAAMGCVPVVFEKTIRHATVPPSRQSYRGSDVLPVSEPE
jgi:hypothetical protein